ncbi:MAG TPA: acyl-CoA dehydratase activase-related protein [Selenomonadales bacterium]|nr:acyl-CoA dehydratase activase-related protein [Selenomonadales bacterium]
MPITVGIPRALLYHDFGELWHSFFSHLAVPVIVSEETNKRLLDRGTTLAVDESCLPLKLYLGHAESLLGRCDRLFVPRIVQHHQGFHFCAKFAGLPDIVRNTFHLPESKLISPVIQTGARSEILKAAAAAARSAGKTPWSGWRSYRSAYTAWAQARDREVPSGNAFTPRIAVIGHSYLLKDRFLCGDIFAVLKANSVTPVTDDEVPRRRLYQEAGHFAPDIYWQMAAKLAGSARYFAHHPAIAGLILVSSFGCGLDSLSLEYIEQQILGSCGKPYIVLNLDEHTGRTGIITRVEAFWDLVKWRRKLESNLPAYGLSQRPHPLYDGELEY